MNMTRDTSVSVASQVHVGIRALRYPPVPQIRGSRLKIRLGDAVDISILRVLLGSSVQEIYSWRDRGTASVAWRVL